MIMKAVQSKRAKKIFSNEANARAILREIHKVSTKDPHIVATVNIDKKDICVKEIE